MVRQKARNGAAVSSSNPRQCAAAPTGPLPEVAAGATEEAEYLVDNAKPERRPSGWKNNKKNNSSALQSSSSKAVPSRYDDLDRKELLAEKHRHITKSSLKYSESEDARFQHDKDTRLRDEHQRWWSQVWEPLGCRYRWNDEEPPRRHVHTPKEPTMVKASMMSTKERFEKIKAAVLTSNRAEDLEDIKASIKAASRGGKHGIPKWIAEHSMRSEMEDSQVHHVPQKNLRRTVGGLKRQAAREAEEWAEKLPPINLGKMALAVAREHGLRDPPAIPRLLPEESETAQMSPDQRRSGAIAQAIAEMRGQRDQRVPLALPAPAEVSEVELMSRSGAIAQALANSNAALGETASLPRHVAVKPVEMQELRGQFFADAGDCSLSCKKLLKETSSGWKGKHVTLRSTSVAAFRPLQRTSLL